MIRLESENSKRKNGKRGTYVATHKPMPKKPKKQAPKPAGGNVIIRGEILKAIGRYKNGASFTRIMERTGFERKQVSKALHALKKGVK